MPLIVIALALFAAGCIAYFAWQFSSREVQQEIESALGRPDDDADSSKQE